MSKGRGNTNANLGAQSRQRSVIILESAPSAELASYDYEAAVSQPEIRESQTNDKQVETSPTEDCYSEKNETTPRDLEKDSTPETVCFSTDNQITGKLPSATELGTENPSQKKIRQQEWTSCQNIVKESGDEGESVDVTLADAKCKELPINPVAPIQSNVKLHGRVSSARRKRNVQNASKIRISSKDLSKRKIVDSSLLDCNGNSKIPRATTITCGVARVYQTARIPSRKSSKNSLHTCSFFSSQIKRTNFMTDSNQTPTTKSRDIFELAKGSTRSTVDLTLNKSKSSRINLPKEDRTEVKADPQSFKQSPKTEIGNAGDHSLRPSPRSGCKSLRLNNACRTCNNRRHETVNLQLSIHDVQNPWSDSKSSPEIGSPDRWSKTLKMSPYIDSTSEEVDLSSEYSSDSMRLEKRKCFTEKTSAKSPISKSGDTRHSPPPRPRRRARFTFFNTLFDIVFWPFLFLRTNR